MRRLFVLIFVVLAGAVSSYFYWKIQSENPARSETVKPVIHAPNSGAPFIVHNENPHWQALLTEYDEYIRSSLRRNLAAGVAVAIVKDTAVYFLKGYGLSDHRTQDSVDVHSVFRLGSVSKCFASILTARLVEDGSLGWDDKVISHLPGFALSSKESTQEVTIRHLLSHTSGLPYHAFTDRVDDGANLDTLIYHLRDLKLTGPPGTTYSYQNVAYSVVGRVIEAAMHRSYDSLMATKVFEPLGMSESSMSFESLISSNHATLPHLYSRKGWKASPVSRTYYNVGPAGGVNASISDMAKFLKAVNDEDNKFLKAGTRREIFKPIIKATARNRNFRKWKRSNGSYYGLGWRVLTFRDDTLNYHGGYVNGYRSELALERADHVAICVLVNSPGQLADNAVPQFFILYEKYRRDIDQWNKRNAR